MMGPRRDEARRAKVAGGNFVKCLPRQMAMGPGAFLSHCAVGDKRAANGRGVRAKRVGSAK